MLMSSYVRGLLRFHHDMCHESWGDSIRYRAASDLRGGTREHPLLYYEYAPTRSGEVAKWLLEGFEGYLQTDGYKGYDGFDESIGIVHVGCFAHARRKFDEALRGQGG